MFTDILTEESHPSYLQHCFTCRVREMPYKGNTVGALSELFCKKYRNLLMWLFEIQKFHFSLLNRDPVIYYQDV